GSDILEAWSAGSKPSGKVNPRAIESMKERGVDLSAQESKGLADLPEMRWDYVITMGCGDACPFVPSKAKRDWAVPDPKDMSPEQFREVRDLIESKVRELIHEASGKSPKVSR